MNGVAVLVEVAWPTNLHVPYFGLLNLIFDAAMVFIEAPTRVGNVSLKVLERNCCEFRLFALPRSAMS